MSHLDEGQLHALLDAAAGERERREMDAHLAVCVECRGRLDDARRLRDQAASILRGAGPDQVVAPPFEEIARRKAEAQTSRSMRVPRSVALAWAASVVLALGIGWFARERLITPAIRPSVVALDEEKAAEGVLESEASARSAVREPAPDEPRAAARRAASPQSDVSVGGRGNVAELAERDRLSDTGPAGAPAQAAPAAPPASDLTKAKEEVAPSETRMDTRRLVAMAVEERETADELVSARWLEVDRDEAQRRLNGPVASIAGLPISSIATAELDGAVVVRITQLLATNRPIELYQQRSVTAQAARARQVEAGAPPAPALDRAARSEATVAVTVWRGYSVTARGPVPADSLHLLLLRLDSIPTRERDGGLLPLR